MRLALVAITAECKDEPKAITFDDPAPLSGPCCLPIVEGTGVTVRIALVAGAAVSTEDRGARAGAALLCRPRHRAGARRDRPHR